jgi:membrane protease subunit HflC
MGNRGTWPSSSRGLVAIVLSMATFSVRETELAIKFELGRIVRADYKPGLHFLVPMLNNVRNSTSAS